MSNDNPLFEISWEVCNLVGGIHTVLSSKAYMPKEIFSDYYLLGPYRGENQTEFIPSSSIPDKFIEPVKNLESKGIKIHFGTWDIESTPQVILVEYLGFSDKTNEIKGLLWNHYQIDSLNSSWDDYDTVMLWSWVCAEVVKELSRVYLSDKIIVHAHEWIAGASILNLSLAPDKDRFRKVFTFHGTMLGRALSGRSQYELLDQTQAYNKAYEVGVHTKHQTELALTKSSDVVTTVSDVLNDEVKSFFGKEPDLKLYNGFDLMIDENFLASRNDLNSYLKNYFYDFGGIKTELTHLFVIGGRYEIHAKGIDVLVKSLSMLNKKLESREDINVVVLFLIPYNDSLPLDPLVKNSFSNQENHGKAIGRDFAPLSPYILPTENEIVSLFLSHGLLNNVEDKVKVIFDPRYLNSRDNLFGKKFYDILTGTDLSIFPSNYEPWGYTPVESLKCYTPTITTDISGFGKYIIKNKISHEGLDIVSFEGKNFDECCENLVVELEKFLSLPARDKFIQRSYARELADKFSWRELYGNYLKSYNE